jgi:dipeptidyl aminopeptidase/acylaminoacyl peptidase
MRDSRGRDKAALTRMNVATGETTVIAESDLADVSAVMVHPTTYEVEAYAVDYTKLEWTALDRQVGEDLDFLRSELPGEIQVVSRTKANDRWIVTAAAAERPETFFLFDRESRALREIFPSRPELTGEPLAPMHPVIVPARDGLELVSYLTLPTSSAPDGADRPHEPRPMVLVVHGGPWARDGYSFNPMHQWLADRGYAVLSVNFRGSVGFGKSFVNAGDLEWAGKMHDDLIDAVDWAVEEGIAVPDKIAIMGGSYGGYATLVGLTFTPDRFACGVDIVGPSNLETLLATIPPYWASFFETFARRVGDPRTEEGRALLKDRSPVYKADRIARPLLIGQGANDPRVKQDESDQIVRAMNDNGLPVTYVLYPDEGHGFARPENRMSFFAASEAFLSEHLGGGAEHIGRDLDGSSIEVPHGMAYVPGLAQALKTHSMKGYTSGGGY